MTPIEVLIMDCIKTDNVATFATLKESMGNDLIGLMGEYEKTCMVKYKAINIIKYLLSLGVRFNRVRHQAIDTDNISLYLTVTDTEIYVMDLFDAIYKGKWVLVEYLWGIYGESLTLDSAENEEGWMFRIYDEVTDSCIDLDFYDELEIEIVARSVVFRSTQICGDRVTVYQRFVNHIFTDS